MYERCARFSLIQSRWKIGELSRGHGHVDVLQRFQPVAGRFAFGTTTGFDDRGVLVARI